MIAARLANIGVGEVGAAMQKQIAKSDYLMLLRC